jgi:hypothetical protein
MSNAWSAGNIPKPTREELDEARHHSEHELAEQNGDHHADGDGHSGDRELESRSTGSTALGAGDGRGGSQS